MLPRAAPGWVGSGILEFKGVKGGFRVTAEADPAVNLYDATD